jgi:hypothetical protein
MVERLMNDYLKIMWTGRGGGLLQGTNYPDINLLGLRKITKELQDSWCPG